MRMEGWELLEERFDDVGVSGATLERLVLQRLMRAASQGLVDRVVVHRFDRLTRSVRDWARLGQFLEEMGVELSVVAGGFHDVGVATSGFVCNLLATFGEFERERIGERLRESRAARSARGLRSSGRVPFGYQSIPASRQLEPHPVEADIVREFFERAAAGETAEAIAAWANDRGIRTKANRKREGSRWTGRTVLQLLQSPLYVGQRSSGNALVPGVHAALVDESTAVLAWEKIAARRTWGPSTRIPLLAIEQDPFMLRGVLRCGGCGGPMTTSASQAVTIETADTVPRYYRCRGSVVRPACRPAIQVPAREVEEAIVARLRRPSTFEQAPVLIQQFLASVDGAWEQLDRGQTTLFVRAFVWAASWHHAERRLEVELDQIMLEQFATEQAERNAAPTPVRPPRAGARRRRL